MQDESLQGRGSILAYWSSERKEEEMSQELIVFHVQVWHAYHQHVINCSYKATEWHKENNNAIPH